MTATISPPPRPPRRRIVRLLIWGAGLLVALAAALALFLSTLDAAIYQRALEAELSDVLDRPVSVRSVSFAVSLFPTLSARDLRIANPPWASRPDFVTAGEAAIRIDLAALWNGNIELRSVELREVDILLERDTNGAGNWRFGATGGDSPPDLPDIDRVELTDARIGWRATDGASVEVQIETANATVRRDRPFRLEAQGVYRGTPMETTVSGDAPLQAALTTDTWALAIALEMPDARATVEARLPTLASTEGAEFSFELSGQRLDGWSKITGTRLPGWGPYRVSAHTRYAGASLQIDNLRLSLDGLPMQPSRLEIGSGKATIGTQVDTRLAAEGKLGETAFSLEATSAPLPRLLQATGAVTVSARGAVAGVALSAEGTLGVDSLAAPFDLALTARGDALALARAFAGASAGTPLPVDLSARVSRAQASYAVKALRGRVVECSVAGDLTLSGQPRPLLGGTLTIGQLDLRQLPLAAPGSVRGTSARPQAARAPAPPAWLKAVDTDLMLRIAGIAGLPVTANSIAARVRLRDGALALEGFGGTLAGIDMSADGVLRWSDRQPQVDAKVRIPVLDLARIPKTGAQPAAADWLDSRFALAPLRDLDATLQLDIGRIAGTSAPIGSLAALARLTRGRLAADPVSLSAAGVPLRGRVVLDASRDDARLEASASTQRVDLAAALRALQLTTTATGQLQDLQLALDTHGTTPRALVAQAQLSLRVGSADLSLGRERTPVALQQASMEVAPGAPLRASAAGRTQGLAFEVTVTGGGLAELLEPERAWPKVQAMLRTSVRGQPMSVTATSGPLQRLLSRRDVPVTLRAELVGAHASLQGTLKDLTAPLSTPLNGRIEVASLAQLTPLLPEVRLPALALSASGRVALGDDEISLNDLAARIGKSDANGRLRLRWRDRFSLNADLTSRLVDIAQWDTPSTTSVPVHDRPLPLQPVRDLDVQLRLRAERILLATYDLDRAVLDAKLANGLLELSAKAAEGNLHGELRFDTRQNVPSVAGRLSLQEVEVRALHTAATASGGASPLLTARAQFAAAGGTLREMLGSTQGEVVLTAGAGTVPMNSSYPIERLTGNLLAVLVPGRKPRDYTQLNCAAARFTLANGVATSTDGIALRFKEIDILGGGAVNLETGQIQFGYRAVRRNWLSFSAIGLASGMAVVGGTIDKPTMQLDPTGVVIGAAAAYATAGLSILAGDLWRKLEATADPCARIVASAGSMNDPLDQLSRVLPKVGSKPSAPSKP